LLAWSLGIINRQSKIGNPKNWGHSLNENNHRKVAKAAHPTCLHQQWFIYASLLSTARCPSLSKPVEVTTKLA